MCVTYFIEKLPIRNMPIVLVLLNHYIPPQQPPSIEQNGFLSFQQLLQFASSYFLSLWRLRKIWLHWIMSCPNFSDARLKRLTRILQRKKVRTKFFIPVRTCETHLRGKQKMKILFDCPERFSLCWACVLHEKRFLSKGDTQALYLS